ncbi:MAG TPA: hypothetical protein DGG95_18365 [Cytophagales bacterium]|jgi:signal transduction histidine kinase|nr:hypothetical protein [Cytophagales bacterium]
MLGKISSRKFRISIAKKMNCLYFLYCFPQMKLAFLFLSILALFSGSKGWSQSNPYQHFTVAEGLPSSEVYYVFQDKKGFIWFATDNGVVRFDGKDMELFQTNAGLSDPVVFEFIEDSKERLWFRTFSGKISYFLNERVYSYPYNDTLSAFCKNSLLQCLYVDANNQLWFSSENVIGKIDTAGHVNIETKPRYTSLALQKVESEIISSNGLVIKSASYNKNNIDSRIEDTISRHSNVCRVKWKGHTYLSFGKTIYELTDKSITPVHTGHSQIISMNIDASNNLWIGFFQNGVESYSGFGEKKSTHFDFLNSKSVTRVLQDKQGGFWMSTLEDGVFYVPQIQVLTNPWPFNLRITRVAKWNGKTVLGNIKGTLLLLNENEEVEQKKELDAVILSILPVSEEKLWVSTTKGVYFLDRSLNAKKFHSIFSDLNLATDGTIWATSSPHVAHFNKEGELLEYLTNTKSNRSIFSNERFLFLFGRLGLQVVTKELKEVSVPKFFGGLKVTKIIQVNDSLLMMGTLGSGFLLVNQYNWTYTQYSADHRFMMNSIYSMLKEDSSIWLGTEGGIAVASIKSIINGNPAFSFFLGKNGKVNNKINYMIPKPKQILVFMDDSFFVIPKEFKPVSKPSFYFQNLLVNNKLVSLKQNQEFDFDQNNVQVNFKLIDFQNQSLLIRSRIRNENPWNYSSDRSIKLYSLQVGGYNLEVEYSIDNVHWNKGINWRFVVMPPWWKTWYFLLSLVMIALGAIILFFKRRVAEVNERNSLINAAQQKLICAELDTQERERNRIATDLHDSVGAGLTAIKMTVWTILKRHGDSRAEDIEKQFQNTIKEIRTIINDLAPLGLNEYGLLETIRDYTSKIERNLNIEIEVNSYGLEIKDAKISLLSFRILQELLSNTTKHSQANKVNIDINSDEVFLKIEYRDNGKGFDITKVEKGWGLQNIESRIQMANGKLIFKSGDFGVSYTIEIPLNPSEIP